MGGHEEAACERALRYVRSGNPRYCSQRSASHGQDPPASPKVYNLFSGHAKSFRFVSTPPFRQPWAASALAILLACSPVRGDALAAVKARGELRWGGDASGGAPYIFETAAGEEPKGFEAELAEALARKLGVRSRFVPRHWEMLPQDLKRGDIDVILNGYEWTPDRERDMASTLPYYIYRLQLVAAANSRVRSWDDLPGKRVGVLSDSAAHRYLQQQFADRQVEIVALGEEGVTGVMKLVRENRHLDATLQDVPAISYYVIQGHGFADLSLIGNAVEPGYYVAFVRPGEDRLRQALDQGMRDLLADGSLRRIYERYGLWNTDQERLGDASKHWPPESDSTTEPIWHYAALLAQSAGATVVLACLSMPLAMVIGLLVALGRLYGPVSVNMLLGLYVEILRGTPLLLQLFVVYYFLPHVGLDLPAFWAGVLALAVNYSAYEAENYRAGLLAIPRGQMEAALALGMSTLAALRYVIVPQAVRVVIPPVTNDFIALFKDTSICSVIAVLELTGRYRGLMVNHPNVAAQVGIMTAALYLLMSYPLSLLARRLEKRFGGSN